MPCPYESGSPIGWCGPGLKCYNHKCLPCLDGMIDYSDGTDYFFMFKITY